MWEPKLVIGSELIWTLNFELWCLILSPVAELAQAVVDAGAVPLLVLCIQEPEIAIKRISASALSDVAKHSAELAQTVVDAGAVAHLAQLIGSKDPKLKRQVYSALSQVAKHSVELAELVVEAEVFPALLSSLKDQDEYVQKNVATLIREIAKHTTEVGKPDLYLSFGKVMTGTDYNLQVELAHSPIKTVSSL